MARWCAGAMSKSTPATTPSRRARRWKPRTPDDFLHSLRKSGESEKRLRQQPQFPRLPEPLPKHVLGVHHLGEAGAIDLHGGDNRRRAGFDVAMAHAVVGILERQSDEFLQ